MRAKCYEARPPIMIVVFQLHVNANLRTQSAASNKKPTRRKALGGVQSEVMLDKGARRAPLRTVGVDGVHP